MRWLLAAIFKKYPLLASELVADIVARKADNLAHDVFYRHGFHLLRKHYYLPIPDKADLGDDFWEKTSDLPGLALNETRALDLLDKVLPPYLQEFRERFPLHEGGAQPDSFFLTNGTYMAVDAHVYYAFIRHFRPKRILEIGGGRSTLLAVAAGLRNARSSGQGPRVTVIDPFPSPLIKTGFAGLTEIIPARVQDVGLDTFASLTENDMLFIDSSHVLRAGGDVQFEYLELLPRLRPGVLVHVHDVSLPKNYPRVYFEQHLYWNEQYVLQAFLAFNSRFEVIWPGNYLMCRHRARIEAAFPEILEQRKTYPDSEPTSFWMRTLG
ncbi:MAG: class I SAM-dependent methyltransferase [Phycisphaerae bacterium]|nr:class I SAM-dependent methyltransferase [Phycisphaerae bacterium]